MTSRCASPSCACDAFAAQFYRPALCVRCFHTIGQHYAGLWLEERDARGGVFFRHVVSGERLLARPADLASSSAAARARELGAAAAPPRPPRDDGAGAGGGGVAASIGAWSSYLESLAPQQGPVGVAASAGAPASSSPSSPPSSFSFPSSATSAAVAVARGSDAAAAAAIGADVADTAASASTSSASPPPTPTRKAGSSIAGAVDPGAGSTREGENIIAGRLVVDEHLLPDAPTAVPAAAIAALAIDVSALSRRMGLAALPSAAAEEHGAGGGNSDAAALKPASDIVPAPVPLTAPLRDEVLGALSCGTVLKEAPFEPLAPENQLPPPADSLLPPPLPSTVPPQLPAVPPPLQPPPQPHLLPPARPALQPQAQLLARAPPAAAAPSPRAGLPRTPAASADPAVDITVHLGPVFGDPLLVDLEEPAMRDANGGVEMFRVQQPGTSEDVLLPRYLLVTPFTMLAVAPHPTRLRMGIIQWERSVLSLRHVISQPMTLQIERAGGGGGGGGGGRSGSCSDGGSGGEGSSDGASVPRLDW